MKDHPDQFENSLVLSALTNGFTLPDDAYVKILKVHNSLAGHAGLDKCLDRLKSSNVQWKYMREHVKHFIKSYPCCQKMSAIKIPIHGHPFTTSAYEPMVRLNMTSSDHSVRLMNRGTF